MRSLKALALATALFTSPAFAATIKLDNSQKIPVVFISGEIQEGDYQTFSKIVDNTPRNKNVLVILSGIGGLFSEGLLIATTVNQYGFETAVLPGNACLSACATIWLAGSRRHVSKDSSIGFHGAFEARKDATGKLTDIQVSSVGNAMLGAFYASVLHLDLATIAFLTEAGPYKANYLTAEKAKLYNIEFSRN